jgi:predicted amidophosphoribosyltransferase
MGPLGIPELIIIVGFLFFLIFTGYLIGRRKKKVELDVKLFCQQCGAKLNPISRFCNHCGSQIPSTFQ